MSAIALSKAHLEFALRCASTSTFTPQIVTLTSTSSATLTWTANRNSVYVGVTPTTGTLAAYAHVDLTVTGYGSPFPTKPYTYSPPDITVTTDVPSDVVHTLSVTEISEGYFLTPPATIEFGSVPVGMSVTKTVPGTFIPGAALGSSNIIDFAANGIAPLVSGDWSLTFTPTSPGAKSTTLTLGAFQSCVFPPNTFLATGTGT